MVFGRWPLKPEGAGSSPAGATKLNSDMRVNEVARVRLGSVNKGPAEDFLEDFIDITEEHPFSRNARIMGGAAIELSRVGPRVHIHDITSLDPGKGHGGAAMRMLQKLAERNGVVLELHAKAYRDDRMDTEQLIKWYQKLGFQLMDKPEDIDLDDGAEMRYYP